MNETSVSRLLPIIADTHATAKNLYDKNINMSSHVQQQSAKLRLLNVSVYC